MLHKVHLFEYTLLDLLIKKYVRIGIQIIIYKL